MYTFATAHRTRHAHVPGRFKTVGRAVLKPRQGLALPLGVYEGSIPQPVFALTVRPRLPDDDVKASLVRMEDHDEYRLTYYLQNFSDRKMYVSVRERYI